MKKVFLYSLFASIVLSANFASARNVWRECGIGGMIFKKTGWAAITSNIIWDLGTTATSSNVSSDDLCEGSSASAAGLIFETYAVLEEEVAMGKGQHLTAMLNMLGCSESSKAAVVTGLRSDLNVQMSKANYSTNSKSENAEIFFNSTMSHAKAANCSAI